MKSISSSYPRIRRRGQMTTGNVQGFHYSTYLADHLTSLPLSPNLTTSPAAGRLFYSLTITRHQTSNQSSAVAPITRSSALSFDSGPPITSLTPHRPRLRGFIPSSSFNSVVGFADPDHPISTGPTFLVGTKTERSRLQGLTQAMNVIGRQGDARVSSEALGVTKKVRVWMVSQAECRGVVVCVVRREQAQS